MLGFFEQSYKFFDEAGRVAPLLVICMLALWYGIGYRIAALRRGDTLPVRSLIRKIESGSPRSPHGILDNAIHDVLVALKPEQRNRARIQSLFSTYLARLNRFEVLVSCIIAVAPLIGLLGTVSGMIETFAALSQSAGTSTSGGIAAGIAEALTATELGLLIAIPGFLLQYLLKSRSVELEGELFTIMDLMVYKKPGLTSQTLTAKPGR